MSIKSSLGFERQAAKVFANTVAKVFEILPWSCNFILAHFLAFIWFDLFGIRKKVIFDNLDIAFPELSLEQKSKIAKNSVRAVAQSFFDVLKIPNLHLLDAGFKQNWVKNNVILHGLENVQTQNRGLLMLSLHLGSGDLATALISQLVIPCSLITKRFKGPFLDQFWFSLREHSKTRFIDPHNPNNSFEILRALKEKRGVIFVVDQFMGKPYGVETKFFGRATGTAYGLALFAIKTGAPVVPVYTRWDENRKLHIYFDAPLDISAYTDLDMEKAKTEITNYFNEVVAQIIRRFPNDWMWLHRRWKKFE